MRIIIASIIVIIVFSLAQSQSQDIAEQLSVIDNGAYVGSKTVIVIKYKVVLKSLSRKFKLSETEIADQSAYAKQTLSEQYAINEAILNIMEGMDEISDSKMGKIKYAECLGSYIVARSKGYTHGQSISSLRKIIRTLKK